MAKKKLPTAKEYIKDNFSPKKKSDEQREADFKIMAKAMVTPKPKSKKMKITVVKPQLITKNMLFEYGFEPLKGGKFFLDGITIEKDKDGFYHMRAPFIKVYLLTINDLNEEFHNAKKPIPELVEY